MPVSLRSLPQNLHVEQFDRVVKHANEQDRSRAWVDLPLRRIHFGIRIIPTSVELMQDQTLCLVLREPIFAVDEDISA